MALIKALAEESATAQNILNEYLISFKTIPLEIYWFAFFNTILEVIFCRVRLGVTLIQWGSSMLNCGGELLK